MKSSNRGVIFLSGLLLAVSGLQSCTKSESPTPESKESKEFSPSTDQEKLAVVPVRAEMLEQEIQLPAELQPFRDVKIHAKLKGFVSAMMVDRGSKVRTGEVLITLTAPELDAQCNELKAKVVAAKSSHAEAISDLEAAKAAEVEIRAKLDADTLTCERLRKASREPGAVAQNEIDMAQKLVEGDEARLKAAMSKVGAASSVVDSKVQAIAAAQNALQSSEAMRQYLTICSPFDGIIAERWVHEGDMAGTEHTRNEEGGRPLLRLIENARLRLVVSVPESQVSGVREGERLAFSVPAYMGRTFWGKVSRISHSLDTKTRTMPVELDVANQNGELDPGMYASVKWKVSRPYKTLFVPASAVLSTLEKTCVIKVDGGKAQLIPVSTGNSMNQEIEVAGQLQEGDLVLLKPSDSIKDGLNLATRKAKAEEIVAAGQKRAASSGE